MKLINVLIKANEIIITDNKYYNASVTIVMRKQLMIALSSSPHTAQALGLGNIGIDKTKKNNLAKRIVLCVPT